MSKQNPTKKAISICTKCKKTSEACECYFVSDAQAIRCTKLVELKPKPKKKLRVFKGEFIKYLTYIRKINNTPLKDLDLSDFGSEKKVAAVVKKFKYCGLSNRDAILDLLGENRVTIITATGEK